MIVEIFGNAGGGWQGLLNALQTRPAGLIRRNPGRILLLRQGTSFVGRALAGHHAEGTATMRPKKSLFDALLSHFLMGVALGLSLVLLLSLIDFFHVTSLQKQHLFEPR